MSASKTKSPVKIIREYLNEYGFRMNQTYFAMILECSRDTITKLENNKLKLSKKLAIKIDNLFGSDLQNWVGNTDNEFDKYLPSKEEVIEYYKNHLDFLEQVELLKEATFDGKSLVLVPDLVLSEIKSLTGEKELDTDYILDLLHESKMLAEVNISKKLSSENSDKISLMLHLLNQSTVIEGILIDHHANINSLIFLSYFYKKTNVVEHLLKDLSSKIAKELGISIEQLNNKRIRFDKHQIENKNTGFSARVRTL